MRHGLMNVSTPLLLGLLAGASPAPAQPRSAGWLDASTLASWNTAGEAVPQAPTRQPHANPRCAEQVRPPQTAEDRAVQARGWDLVGPFQGGWHVVVVRGAAGYDGMCRPLQFQDFVFVRGAFAGTLAPAPMDSRTDGALGTVWIEDEKTLRAAYTRYEASDPLCCPSRTSTVTFAIGGAPAVVRPTGAETTPDGDSSSTSRPAPTSSARLSGTSWRLVKFEGGDGEVSRPDDRSKYTIAFEEGGGLSARIDCNRGRGSWRSERPGHLALGPMAMTLMQCASGSLHDRIVRSWNSIGSYVIRDGHLFLSLTADGGIYEFEPQ